MNESCPVNQSVEQTPQKEPRWRRRLKLGLLGVILVMGGFLALVVAPAVMEAREAARRSGCKCALKQFGLALHNYHAVHGCFPPAIVLGPDGQPWHSWRVLTLPYLECQPIYAKYRFDEPWDGPNNIRLLKEMPSIFACPSRPRETQASVLAAFMGLLGCAGHSPTIKQGLTSYAAALGPNCAFRGTQSVALSEFTDGPANTVLIGEATRTRIPWTKPEDVDIAFHARLGDAAGFSSPHAAGAHFLFADGMVRFVRATTPQTTIDALFTRNGGDQVGEY